MKLLRRHSSQTCGVTLCLPRGFEIMLCACNRVINVLQLSLKRSLFSFSASSGDVARYRLTAEVTFSFCVQAPRFYCLFASRTEAHGNLVEDVRCVNEAF